MPNHNDLKIKPKLSAHASGVLREEEKVVVRKHESCCQPVQQFVQCISVLHFNGANSYTELKNEPDNIITLLLSDLGN